MNLDRNEDRGAHDTQILRQAAYMLGLEPNELALVPGVIRSLQLRLRDCKPSCVASAEGPPLDEMSFKVASYLLKAVSEIQAGNALALDHSVKLNSERWEIRGKGLADCFVTERWPR